MCTAQSLEFLNLDPEIERTLRRLRRKRRERVPNIFEEGTQNQGGENQAQQALRDYFRPIVADNYSGIHRQAINGNNFELKLALINMVQHNQYRGLAHEDPNVHLATFLEIVNTVKMNGVTEDVIQMRLFPFSLKDRARRWLQSLQLWGIDSWEEFAQRLLSKFFLPCKTS